MYQEGNARGDARLEEVGMLLQAALQVSGSYQIIIQIEPLQPRRLLSIVFCVSLARYCRWSVWLSDGNGCSSLSQLQTVIGYQTSSIWIWIQGTRVDDRGLFRTAQLRVSSGVRSLRMVQLALRFRRSIRSLDGSQCDNTWRGLIQSRSHH